MWKWKLRKVLIHNFFDTLGPIHNFFLTLFKTFRNFYCFHLLFKILSKASVLLRNHHIAVKHAQNRLVTLPRCPYDTLDTHSTLPRQILGPEGSNLQKSTFSVVSTTLEPTWRGRFFRNLLKSTCKGFYYSQILSIRSLGTSYKRHAVSHCSKANFWSEITSKWLSLPIIGL